MIEDEYTQACVDKVHCIINIQMDRYQDNIEECYIVLQSGSREEDQIVIARLGKRKATVKNRCDGPWPTEWFFREIIITWTRFPLVARETSIVYETLTALAGKPANELSSLRVSYTKAYFHAEHIKNKETGILIHVLPRKHEVGHLTKAAK